MKKVFFLMVAMAFAAITTGQNINYSNEGQGIKTIFDNDQPVSHGGYGALVMKYGKILDQDAWYTGVRGGWLIGHSFTLGIAGNGLVSRVVNDAWLPEDPDPNVEARLFMGYGGLLLEPVIFHRELVHIAIPITIGAGGAAYGLQSKDYWSEPEFDFPENGEAFFAFEPGLEIEINALRFMRINLGASYLYTSDVRMPSVDPGYLRGFQGTFGLKFGAF